jgi:hypothetical protein
LKICGVSAGIIAGSAATVVRAGYATGTAATGTTAGTGSAGTVTGEMRYKAADNGFALVLKYVFPAYFIQLF